MLEACGFIMPDEAKELEAEETSREATTAPKPEQ
jgi:hypothetical protein